jgi:uncharacterized protein CbrC (UPF0167 family)
MAINTEYRCDACGSWNVYAILNEAVSDYFLRNNVYSIFCKDCDYEGTALEPYPEEYSEEHLQAPVPAEATVSEDVVNKPPHYRKHPSGVECIDITEHMDFCLGNAMKYIWRAGLKGDKEVEDLQKAVYYLNRKIKQFEKECNTRF